MMQKPTTCSWVLLPLLEFLNLPEPSSSPRTDAIIRGMSREDIASLQEQLIADLLPLTSTMPYERADEHLKNLCSRIDSFDYSMRLSPLPADRDVFVGEPNSARNLISHQQKLFKWGDHAWIFNPDSSLSKEDSAEKKLYLLVAAGLQKAELSMLRRCQQCERFFIAREKRQVFCSPDHSRAYWDTSERLKKRVYRSRKKARRNHGN